MKVDPMFSFSIHGSHGIIWDRQADRSLVPSLEVFDAKMQEKVRSRGVSTWSSWKFWNLQNDPAKSHRVVGFKLITYTKEKDMIHVNTLFTLVEIPWNVPASQLRPTKPNGMGACSHHETSPLTHLNSNPAKLLWLEDVLHWWSLWNFHMFCVVFWKIHAIGA